jgi:hypothetical protein
VSPSASEERRVRWRLEMREVVVVRMLEYQVDIVGRGRGRCCLSAPTAGGWRVVVTSEA